MHHSNIPAAPGIYAIVNTINMHRYIGSSSNLRKRYVGHLSNLQAGKHHSRYLQNAYNLHGCAAFKFEIIELVTNVHDLIVREQHHIDTFHPEYNMSPTAGNCLGVRHTSETRRKLSTIRQGRKLSAEHRANLRKPKPPGFGEKISALKKGQIISLEQRAKLSAKIKGRPLPPEQLAKVQEVNRKRLTGKKRDPEIGKKISAAKMGKPLSPEHIEKNRLGHLGKTIPSETKAKMSAAKLGKLKSEETKAKMRKPKTAEHIANAVASKRRNKLARISAELAKSPLQSESPVESIDPSSLTLRSLWDWSVEQENQEERDA